MRVLLIDDHPLFREGLKGLLLGLEPSVQVEQAGSVDAAEALQGQAFELVLMDLQMPGSQGMEALSRTKALFEASAVVVVSGDESPDTIQRAIQHGAAGYVPKSSDPSVTIQALRLVLAQGTYLPTEALRHPAGGEAAPSPPEPSAHPSHHSPYWPQALSPRQLSVLRCLLQGKPNKVIAREIGIAEGTVKVHLWAVYQLLGVSNRAQAMYRAHELQLFSALGSPVAAPAAPQP